MAELWLSPTNLTNNGIIQASGNNAVLALSLQLPATIFSNAGGLQAINGGQLYVTPNTTSTGNITSDVNTWIIFSNGLTQTAGTTTVNGTLDLVNSVFNLQGGTLKGAGTILGPVNNTGGTVSPGNSPGKLTIQGDYTQGANATALFEIGGYAQGTQYDWLHIAGHANLGGIADIKLVNGFVPQSGDTFTLLDAGSLNGMFSSVQSLDNGVTYSFLYNTANNTFSVTANAVPEANSLTILLTLLGAGAVVIRKSHRCKVSTASNEQA